MSTTFSDRPGKVPQRVLSAAEELTARSELLIMRFLSFGSTAAEIPEIPPFERDREHGEQRQRSL